MYLILYSRNRTFINIKRVYPARSINKMYDYNYFLTFNEYIKMDLGVALILVQSAKIKPHKTKAFKIDFMRTINFTGFCPGFF